MKNEEYKGSSDIVGRLGQASLDGTVGGAVGGVAGALAGAALHDPATTARVRRAIQVASSKAPISTEVHRVLNESRGGRRLWQVMSRKGKSIAGAIAGMIIVSGVVELVSFFRGSKRAQQGRHQFEELQRRNEALTLHFSEIIGPQHSFVEKLDAEREAAANLQPQK